MHMYAKLIRGGRVGFEYLAEVRNQLSEDLSFRRILRLAQSVPGTTLYMMHGHLDTWRGRLPPCEDLANKLGNIAIPAC